MTNIDERALFSVINTEFLDLSHNLLYSVNLSKLRNLHFVNITHNRFTNVPSFKDESGDLLKFIPKLNFNLNHNFDGQSLTPEFIPSLKVDNIVDISFRPRRVRNVCVRDIRTPITRAARARAMFFKNAILHAFYENYYSFLELAEVF